MNSLHDLSKETLASTFSKLRVMLENILKQVPIINVFVHDVSLVVLVEDIQQLDDVGVWWQSPQGPDFCILSPIVLIYV